MEGVMMEHQLRRFLEVLGAALFVAVVLVPAQAGAATDVGTATNPVRLSAAAEDTVPELQLLADALHDATGLEFVVEFAGWDEQAVDWLCASHRSTGMRIANSSEFVYAAGCGVETRLSLLRFGKSGSSAEFLVPQDSTFNTLDDLTGLVWYFGDEASFLGYMVPLGMLNLAGVTNQIPTPTGTHAAAVQEVYDNSVASSPVPVFASVFTDARTQIEGAHPDVYVEARVLVESPAIPNNPIAFGPTFPAEVRAPIEAALVDMADPVSPNHADWVASMEALFPFTSGLVDVTLADFDFLKSAMDASGLWDWGSKYAWGTFIDDNTSVFEADIEWMAAAGITKGCNPPLNDLFCPDASVTRGQMAAFLVRALGLTDRLDDPFTDDDDSIFEADIEKLAAAGITRGCNPPVNDRFCPDSKVTREVMAAFLVRALGYTDPGAGDLFSDDDLSIFEGDIDRMATAGVTKGCNPPTNDKFCPKGYVTRGQMAAFLHRALG
jgi:ABC-type phosphate/phosphonate transport system substrate-binding protein